MVKKLFCLLLTLFTLALVVGCGNDNANPANNDKIKVHLGMLRLTSSTPLFIAMDKGFFAEEGIEIEPQWFDAAHPIAVATASSKIDVGATGITASLYNMAANGQKLAIVADKGREEKSYSSSALLVTTDNYNAGVTSLKDLKGKRIGITQKGSTFHYMLGRMLKTQGMSLNDVEIIPLNKISAVMAALESKQIDGCILNEPNVTKVQKAGYGKLVVQVGDVIPYQTSAVFYSPKFMQNKDAAERFMKAYVKACRYYYTATVERKDEAKLNEVINITAKYVKAPPEDIKAGLPYIDKNGQLLTSDIQTQIDWYTANNMLSGKLQASDIANTSFQEAATK